MFLFPVFAGSATEHTAIIIDGRVIAQQGQQEFAVEFSKMKESVGKAPGLAVILVDTHKDSETYVQIKKKACEEVGFDSFGVKLPDNATQDEILDFVKKFNDNPAVHGIQGAASSSKGLYSFRFVTIMFKISNKSLGVSQLNLNQH